MDAKKLGLFIAEQRKKMNMTQSDLAEKLHVTDKAVSRWERGQGLPDIHSIERLAEVLDVSIEAIFKCEIASTIQEADFKKQNVSCSVINGVRMDEEWEQVKKMIYVEANMASLSYETWVQPLQLYKSDDKKYYISVPNEKKLAYNYISSKYGEIICSAIRKILNSECEIEFVVEG